MGRTIAKMVEVAAKDRRGEVMIQWLENSLGNQLWERVGDRVELVKALAVHGDIAGLRHVTREGQPSLPQVTDICYETCLSVLMATRQMEERLRKREEMEKRKQLGLDPLPEEDHSAAKEREESESEQQRRKEQQEEAERKEAQRLEKERQIQTIRSACAFWSQGRGFRTVRKNTRKPSNRKKHRGHHHNLIMQAACSGNLPFLKWMAHSLDKFDRLHSLAAEHGHHLVVRWLENKSWGYKDPHYCLNAAERGRRKRVGCHLDALKWLRENLCEWDEGVCTAALVDDHLEILEWAMANGCPWDGPALMEIAERRGEGMLMEDILRTHGHVNE
ncbi:Plectin [Balamuthia mandrillaris]